MSAARPAGPASGCLSGQYPFPGPGCFPLSGISIQEDFLYTDASVPRIGDLPWTETTLGAGGSYSANTTSSAYEHGLIGLTTALTADGDGVTYSLGAAGAPIFYGVVPPEGTICTCKLKMTSTSSYEVWAGIIETQGSDIQSATNVEFLGIRSTGGNLFGVCKTGAATEDTQDLGVSCESAFVTCGFEMTDATHAQFFIFETPNLAGMWSRTNVGTPMDVSAPAATTGSPCFGLITSTNLAKAGKFDFFSIHGRIDR